MSSYQGSHSGSSPRLVPFQSAQPQGSIFGGPSSQDVAEPQHNAKLEGSDEEENEFEAFLRGQALFDNDVSDDATYKGSDESDSGDNDAGSERSTTSKQLKADGLDEVPETTGPAVVEPSMDGDNVVSEPAREQPASLPPSPEYRPNRFRRSDISWRRITAGDRMKAEAIESLRSRDLAAHLYNAYALRMRASRILKGNASKEEKEEAEAFLPSRLWTAWPMRASDVPRVNEYLQRQEGEGWLRMPPDLRPSAELEEEIIAVMLKTAKERFEARGSMPKVSAVHMDKSADVKDDDDGEGVEAKESEDEKIDVGSMDEVELRPVVQADDDKSRRQLLPLTRNILTQFDNVLMGLHHARKNILNMEESSASEWQSDSETATSPPSKAKRRKATERSQSRDRKRIRRSSNEAAPMEEGSKHAGASIEPDSPSERSTSSDTSPSRSRTTEKRVYIRNRFGFRDWSDVMGLASMQGWPPAVVMRAAKRCSRLFNEDMAFETLKEGRVEQAEDEDRLYWKYTEGESEVEEETEEEKEATPPRPPPPRASRVRSRATYKKRGRTPRTSRARSRAISKEKEPTPTPAPETPAPEIPIVRRAPLIGKGQHRKKDIVCPHETCERHIEGFSRTWNLTLHLRRAHKDDD